MIKYRSGRLIRSGFIGAVLIILTIAVGLQPERLVSLATSIQYQAVFSEAAGVTAGNDVKISGVKVGSVSDVSLDRGHALVSFNVNSSVSVGSQSTAHIRTGTLLGERVLTVESVGDRNMQPRAVIPVSRTSSPYSLTDAVSDLTTNVSGTDTNSLNQSLDVLSSTIDQISPQLGPTFDGLTRLSRSLNGRNETIGQLLKNAADVTAVLAERSDGLNELILNAGDLTAELVARRQAIMNLLADTSALAEHISGLIDENGQQLAPALQQLNSVIAVLERNRDNLAKALPGLAKFQSGLSEIVASGPYYVGYIPNITQGVFLQPFLDYAFGFRRGVNAGQPPDNAGPRAEIPLPRNGIPGAPR